MAASDARPVPRRNTAFRLYFTLYNSEGLRVSDWTSPTAIRSKDGDAFASTTNPPIEIGSSGYGYIDLTNDEMDADAVIVSVSVANAGVRPRDIVLYPDEEGDYRVTKTGYSLSQQFPSNFEALSISNDGEVTVCINHDKLNYCLSNNSFDTILVEDGINARQALSSILASTAGVLLGAGTGSITIYGGNTTIPRITATTDALGNRTSVTLSLPV